MFGKSEIADLAERLEFLTEEFAAHYIGLSLADASKGIGESWIGCTVTPSDDGASVYNSIMPEFEFRLVRPDHSHIVEHVSGFGTGRFKGFAVFSNGRSHHFILRSVDNRKPSKHAIKLAREFAKSGKFADIDARPPAPDYIERAKQLLFEADGLARVHRDKRGPEGLAAFHKAIEAFEIFEENGDEQLKQLVLPLLAMLYAELVEGDRDKNIDQSIKIYRSLMSQFDRSTDPEEWASFARDLALTYREKRSGYEDDHIELAIATLEEALAVLAEPHFPKSRATVLDTLAQTYLMRPRGHAAQNRAEAARLYKYAVECLEDDDPYASSLETERLAVLARLETSSSAHSTTDTQASNSLGYFAVFESEVEKARKEGLVFQLTLALMNYGDALLQHGFAYREKQSDEDLRQPYVDALERAIELFTESLSLLDGRYDPEKVGLLHEKIGRSNLLLGHFSALDDVGEENIAALYTPASEHIGVQTASYLLKSIEHFQSALGCFLPYSYERTREGLTLEIANAWALLREWDEAAKFYKKAQSYSSGAQFGVAAPRDRVAEQLRRFGSISEIGAFSFARAERKLEAIAFADSRKSRLVARALGLNTASFSSTDRKAIDEGLEELSRLESRLLSPDLFARRPVIERVIELRSEIDRLSAGHFDVSDTQLSEALSHLLDERSALIVPIFSSLGGSILMAYLNRGEIQIKDIAVGNSIDFRQLFDHESEGWATRYLAAINALKAADPTADEQLFEAVQKAAQGLDDLFVGDMTARLAAEHSQIEKLLIVPQGRLAQLPIGAIADQSGRASIGDFELAFLPSVISVYRLSQIVLTEPKIAVGFGATADFLGSPDMEFSRLECALVSSFSNGSAEYIETVPTAGETLPSALSHAAVWHFPTHGEFIPDDPLASFIQTGTDTKLTLRRLFEARSIQAPELVVLSACETGVYDEEAPDEFIGWPSAFLQLGAKGVVAALWPVETLPTTLLMGKFYELLFGADDQTVPAALHGAQIWLKRASVLDFLKAVDSWGEKGCLSENEASGLRQGIEFMQLDNDEVAFSEPLYWAGFSFYGVPGLSLGPLSSTRLEAAAHQ